MQTGSIRFIISLTLCSWKF